jgi:hypothetical protein
LFSSRANSAFLLATRRSKLLHKTQIHQKKVLLPKF